MGKVTFKRMWEGEADDWLKPEPASINAVIGLANQSPPKGTFNGVDLAADQAWLRWALGKMERGRAPLREVREAFGSVRLSATAKMNAHGKIECPVHPECETIRQFYAMALAALIHSGMADRVKRCADEKCKKFFVSWPRRGRPQEYCCKQHQDRDYKRKPQ